MNDEQKARVIANCEIIAKALREGKVLQERWNSGNWTDFSIVGVECEYREVVK